MKQAKLTISSTSLSTFRQSLRQAAAAVEMSASEGLAEAADHAFAIVQSRTPRVTGSLAASGHVTDQSEGTYLRRTISYGDGTINPESRRPTSEYAAVVHEVYHPMHPNSYKWLERSILEYGQESFIVDLANTLRRAL